MALMSYQNLRSLVALTLRSSRIVRIGIADGTVETLTDAAGPSPDGLVAVGDILYWTTMGQPTVGFDVPSEKPRDFSRRDGGVHALRPDTGERYDVVPPGGLTTGKQLAYDAAGTLYWSDREGCKVSRARVDGTGLEDVVVNDPAGGALAECVGVAVDPNRGYVYWTQKGPPKGGQGRILRAGIDLPTGDTAAHRSDIEILWDGLPEPIDLEIVGDRLYWTDRGAAPFGNTLNRAPLPRPGHVGAMPEILGGGFREAIGLAVDENSGLAYVSDLGGEIVAIPLPDGPAAHIPRRVVLSMDESITGLAFLR
jgi:hypothetical protein